MLALRQQGIPAVIQLGIGMNHNQALLNGAVHLVVYFPRC